jgi:preprotein translocase subunit SecY
MSKILNSAKKIVSTPVQFFKKKTRQLAPKSAEKKTWLSSLSEIFRNKEIRNKLLITILIIAAFRILAAIPLPGIDASTFSTYTQGTPFSNIFTIITGGRLDNPSVVAIGLAPFINASIIIQLLSTVIPSLEELQKEGGEAGRQKLNQYTRLLTLPLALIQGFVIYTILKNTGLGSLIKADDTLTIATLIFSLAAGSIFLMWLSEIISENGIGNGSSIIIATGILASLPGFISQDFQSLAKDIPLLLKGQFEILWSDNLVLIYSVVVALLLLLAVIVFINEATRKITIQYARRVRESVANTQSSYLPIKLNQAGVMPVIFASSILILPQIISQFVLSATTSGWLFDAATAINGSFLTQFRSLGYNVLDFFLIIGFAFFYTFVVQNPNDVADNLKKSGGFIPGIRPGGSTTKFLTSVMIRLTTFGAIFLGVIALAPSLINKFLESGILTGTANQTQYTLFSGIGGTSLLILVGVILDTMRQFKSMNVVRSYEEYKD